MYVLEAVDIHKSYGGVAAVRGVDFRVAEGTVHALLGENGAGKSTLGKVLTGVVRQDSGEVRLGGEVVRFADSGDAAKHGVAVVSQELNLFPDLDVLSNLFMGRAPLKGGIFDRKTMEERATPVLADLGLNISVRTPVGQLSLAQQQLVEIAKAMLTNPRVLILDEPTSALDDEVAARLLRVIEVLRDRKVGVVFVSHILEEVMALSDVVTVLRDGEVVMREAPRADLTIEDIVKAMVGEHHTDLSEGIRGTTEVVIDPNDPMTLTVDSVSTADGRLRNVSLVARRGEIVGLAGVVGAGHRGLLEIIAGFRHASSGSIHLPNETGGKAPKSLRRAVRRGVAVVSGDRKRGLLHDSSIWSNVAQVQSVALARDGWLPRRKAMRDRAKKLIRDLNVKTSGVEQDAGMLSGGNQQKVVMAKWFAAAPTVMLLDDPTRGVAVGSKADIHRLLRRTCDNAVVLLCSTDLDELVTLCDRVLVFRRGEISAELRGDDLNRQRLLTEMNAGAQEQELASGANA